MTVEHVLSAFEAGLLTKEEARLLLAAIAKRELRVDFRTRPAKETS